MRKKHQNKSGSENLPEDVENIDSSIESVEEISHIEPIEEVFAEDVVEEINTNLSSVESNEDIIEEKKAVKKQKVKKQKIAVFYKNFVHVRDYSHGSSQKCMNPWKLDQIVRDETIIEELLLADAPIIIYVEE